VYAPRPAAPSGPKGATLVLKRFSETPWLEFGVVRRGESATAVLCIENPSESEAVLTLGDIPKDTGDSSSHFCRGGVCWGLACASADLGR
jgi:hypothetical protein